MDKKIPVVPIKAAGQTDVTNDIMNTIIKISGKLKNKSCRKAR